MFSTNKICLYDGNNASILVLEQLTSCMKLFLTSDRKFHDYCWVKLGRYDREHGAWENVFCIPSLKNKARYIASRLNLR